MKKSTRTAKRAATSKKVPAISCTSILIAGVGGQGIILASEILSDALLHAGFDVKKNEIHGMSQRGGSVTSHIRFGKKVYSPIIPDGTADFILAFERLESLRELPLLRNGGTVIVNNEKMIPTTVEFGGRVYPEDIETPLRKTAADVVVVNAVEEARTIGNQRVFNVLLLGVLAARLKISEDAWMKAIEAHVKPEHRENNLKAFARGREL
ncbi:MAG: indolepyruvate oxidoreductase subunit beta [Spirochaetes bacterium]|nr:indolepyruvate oxidoreductase subunit beta [Spirochaetota bacterium]